MLQQLIFFTVCLLPELDEEIQERWETFVSGTLADTNKQNTVDLVRCITLQIYSCLLWSQPKAISFWFHGLETRRWRKKSANGKKKKTYEHFFLHFPSRLSSNGTLFFFVSRLTVFYAEYWSRDHVHILVVCFFPPTYIHRPYKVDFPPPYFFTYIHRPYKLDCFFFFF